MLPLVCNDANAILFMFDLTRPSTLNSIREWFRQARGFNRVRGAAQPRVCAARVQYSRHGAGPGCAARIVDAATSRRRRRC